ncbi:HAD family phosphatase [Herbivorax sp. ANBcel31]|uniref:HAD family hydrolase n=1 Tax=Herbivorax sp. ANBcel31 TaxID=3069754 RepID=UPI0027B3838D|nr:HAD family phosphatase [Herbivorax sp. ANBcel31]MDQ2084820.1 HAD family phosphatase [Herbivorax sp. ANBcel31]
MKAIIFDMDGLMIDTEGLYFETERIIAKKFNKEVKDETLWEMMGRKPIEAIGIFANHLEIDIPLEELLELRDKLFVQKLKEKLVPMPGIFDILDEFKNKMKLAIATGSPDKFLQIVLDKLDLKIYFEVLQPSDKIINGKPHPEMYLRTIDKLQVLPSDSVVLEDSSNGALAGVKAGCYTIAIPNKYTYKQDFSFVDYIAESLFDAKDHIKKIAKHG